jgi:hypothetical protein
MHVSCPCPPLSLDLLIAISTCRPRQQRLNVLAPPASILPKTIHYNNLFLHKPVNIASYVFKNWIFHIRYGKQAPSRLFVIQLPPSSLFEFYSPAIICAVAVSISAMVVYSTHSLRKDYHSLPFERLKEPSVLCHKIHLCLYEISREVAS